MKSTSSGLWSRPKSSGTLTLCNWGSSCVHYRRLNDVALTAPSCSRISRLRRWATAGDTRVKDADPVDVPTKESTERLPRGYGDRYFVVVGLCALAALICSVDRAAISVAILPMAEEYQWSDTTKGAVNSAFYVGYTITNLLGGYLATKLGAKRVLGSGVVFWSVFTMLTPLASGITLPLLYATRAAVGMGEGVTFPSVQNMVKGWVPADKRSRALTLIYAGGQLGTILALLTAPAIIHSLGWQAVFVLYGALGLFWMLAWQPLVGDEEPLLTREQRSQMGSITLKDVPWRQFFSNRPYQAILMAHGAFGVGHFVSLSWLPTYYFQEFDVNIEQSAWLSLVPWLMTVLVSSSSGFIADGLVNNRVMSLTATRKLLQTLGTVGPAACLLYLASGDPTQEKGEVGEALALLTATLALGGFQSAGFASNHQDLSGRYAAVLFGITNATSSLVGSLSVYGTGLILDATHSWSLVFTLVAGAYLIGATFYLMWGSSEQQFD